MTTPTPAVDTTKPARRPATPTATPPTQKVSRLRHWEPDPRWMHPLAAALWTLTLAVGLYYTNSGVPPWTLAGIGLMGAAIGVGRARKAWPVETFGDDARASMSVLAVVAGVMAGAWLVYAMATNPLRAAGWLLLIAIWCGAWYAYLRGGAKKAAAAIVVEGEAAEAAREQAQLDEAVKTWGEILASTNLKLKVVDIRPTRGGYVIGVEPSEAGKAVSFPALSMALPDLTVKAAAALASSGVQIRAGDVRVEETGAAHVHLIHVCTKQVLAQTIPYEPIGEPTTIADPIDIGLYEDGQPVNITFGGETGGVNGKIVGATRSGKSVVANCIVGRVGECVDAITIVMAPSKLVPLVYPWIKPWLQGKAERPGIDGVFGQDPVQVLAMMAQLYRLACGRNDRLGNRDVHEPTPQAPAVVAIIEEAGKMVGTRDAKGLVHTIKTHDGHVVDFSGLLDLLTSVCLSAQISVIPMNQNDLFGSMGTHGSEIARNTLLRICLQTMEFSDGPSVLPALTGTKADTTKLLHKSMLIQVPAEKPRVMAAKAYKLTRDDVHPVAIRNAAWRPGLEPDLAVLLGDVWADRWNAARLPELVNTARRDGLEWPVTGKPVDPIEAELHNMIAQTMAADSPTLDNPTQAGDISLPDPSAGIAELNAITNKPALTLPEPLAAVMALLAEPQAPKDWISTQQLAILLGRVTAESPFEDRKAAAQKLGRELSTIDKRIRAEPKDRMQGYDVPLLKKLAAEIARGGK